MRWILVLLLTVASATGWAQSGSGSLTEATTRAWNASIAAEQALQRATRAKNELNSKFTLELEAAERLKNAPKSWRTDRELREKRSDADALGRQVDAATIAMHRAADQLAAARRTLIAAIDAELASAPSTPRKAQLDRARALVAPHTRRATRIVLPETKIDPNADPEDLDVQARAIKEVETELANQLAGLEVQAKELQRIALLRRQHDRSIEIERRDDNTTRKGATPTGRGTGGALADAEQGPSPAPPQNDGGRPDVSTFESDATITLAEIVDPQTIEALNRAQRSNDPNRRAAVAKLTRDAVAKKLQDMRDKRRAVEAHAASLRNNLRRR